MSSFGTVYRIVKPSSTYIVVTKCDDGRKLWKLRFLVRGSGDLKIAASKRSPSGPADYPLMLTYTLTDCNVRAHVLSNKITVLHGHTFHGN